MNRFLKFVNRCIKKELSAALVLLLGFGLSAEAHLGVAGEPPILWVIEM